MGSFFIYQQHSGWLVNLSFILPIQAYVLKFLKLEVFLCTFPYLFSKLWALVTIEWYLSQHFFHMYTHVFIYTHMHACAPAYTHTHTLILIEKIHHRGRFLCPLQQKIPFLLAVYEQWQWQGDYYK